jgi:predicted nucleic acid-binding protein
MPETQEIVINTSPIIAIVAALEDLRVLQIYRKVWVPLEVCQEIIAGGPAQFALAEFHAAHWLQKSVQTLSIAANLLNTLDSVKQPSSNWP